MDRRIGHAEAMTSFVDERDAILDALERILRTWHEHESFDHAVTETVSRTGYAAADVAAQLRHVAVRCRAEVLRELLVDEHDGVEPDPADLPSTVLVLASGGVPGLVIEGIASALAVGATALVRPSRDETILHHLLGGLRAWEPALADRIEVVGTGGVDVPWNRAEAAVVFGSNETIARVRELLPAAASRRVAGYGSRQGIAVLAAGADIDASWAERLADDVLTFRQRGCMSPSWIFVVGDDATADELVSAIGRELALGRTRHLAPGVEDHIAQRRSSDADVLGAIAAGMAVDSTAFHTGDARVTVVRVPTIDALGTHVAHLGSLLQTAVVATGIEDRPRIAEILLDSGCTRVCLPGDAHWPDPRWPQDGIGRIAPLLG